MSALSPSPVRHGAALVLLAGCQFVLILDSAIVWVAMPSIGRELGMSAGSLSWLANGYSLAFGGFMLLGGRLADLVGRRRLFIAALHVFALASLVGALSTAPELLLGARVVQGLAAAAIAPASMALMMVVFPDGTEAERRRRSRAFGIWSALGAVGGSVGFFLGGALTDFLGWPSVFAVNVPIGLAFAFLGPRLLPESRQGGSWRDFDVLGAVLSTGGILLLVYLLGDLEGQGWASVKLAILGPAAVAALIAFVVVESGRAHPLLPLRIFRSPLLTAAAVINILANMAIVPTVFFLSLYTQQTLGFTPLQSGLASLPLALSIALWSTVGARLTSRYPGWAVAGVGLALFSAGLVWLSQISGGSYPAEVVGPLLVIGAGGGLTFVAATLAGTAQASPHDRGVISGVLGVAQQFGGAVGLAVLTAVAGAFADPLAGLRAGLLGAAGLTGLGVLQALWLPVLTRREARRRNTAELSEDCAK